MITLDGNHIHINPSREAVEHFIGTVEIDYLEVNPALRSEQFYNRHRHTEEIPGEKEFVPIIEFVRKITRDELKQEEDMMQDEEEYNTLIQAFVRSRMFEAYGKYSHEKPREHDNTMDRLE